MSHNIQQQSIEKFCPVCDACEIYVELTQQSNKDGSIDVKCEKCGYQKHYTKEEMNSLKNKIA